MILYDFHKMYKNLMFFLKVFCEKIIKPKNRKIKNAKNAVNLYCLGSLRVLCFTMNFVGILENV